MYGAVDLANDDIKRPAGAGVAVKAALAESVLMDSLNPESPPFTVAASLARPPRVWKFWGTALWGLFIFAAMFAGQIAVWLVRAAAHGPIDLAAADPRARQRPDDLAVGDHGAARRARRAVAADPSVAHVVRGLSGAALDLVEQSPARRRRAWSSLVDGLGHVSRATGREVTPGFMGDVLKSARADGALWLLVLAFCVAAPITEEFFARGFLYRGWSESFLAAVPAPSCCRRWYGRRCTAVRLVLPRRGVFDRPAVRLSALSQPVRSG